MRSILPSILNKAGVATQRVARALCGVPLGSRIPTVNELVEICDVVRGNVQKALCNLKESGAVALEAHGQNGTILLDINYLALAEACGVDHLVGVMPLPYTGRYEGLATGLFGLLGATSIRSYISFMRGSEARVQSLLDGFADYCVMSRLAFQEYLSRGVAIEPVLDCGAYSYVGRHVLLMRQDETALEEVRLVGIDETSADQRLLTRRYFANRPVRYVPIQYTQIVSALQDGRIDVGIWNEDDLHLNEEGLVARELSERSVQYIDDTHAVVVVRSGDELTAHLIRELIDIDELLAIQGKVMRGEIPARY